MDFIKNFFVCEKYFMQPNDIITYGSLVQGAMREYHNSVESKRWERTDIKNISKMSLYF